MVPQQGTLPCLTGYWGNANESKTKGPFSNVQSAGINQCEGRSGTGQVTE